jgi:arabinose-5-phosphate isomerase
VKVNEIILKTALHTVQVEAAALLHMQKYLNNDFVETIKLILNGKGRLVITGVGKSAIVGQKIVSTLNSTGTPSLFMHAADAVHGDLGMIVKGDIVCCISKSGNTPEIKILIPFLKSRGIPVIAMVSHKESYLAKEADYILFTPVEKEADPNNLAPTTSSIVQMAMGDALATSLLAVRNFSPQDFALFHPGGSLGKQLYLKVDHIYKMNEKPLVKETDDLNKIIFEISSKRLGATAVVDESGILTGIITDGDLRRMLLKNTELHSVKAKEIMSPHPKTIEPEVMAIDALELMRINSITQLIICNSLNEYLGFIHLHDLLREGLV